MTEKEKYDLAMQLMRGTRADRDKAAVIFAELIEKTNAESIRMQSILILVVLLNHVEHNPQIIEACDNGIALGKKLNDYGSVAYLMSIKAKGFEMQSSLYNYQRQSLSSALGWFNYSLESDKEKADSLDKKGDMAERQSKDLIDGAIKIAEKIQRMDALANILMMSGQIYGDMYLTEKIRKMKNPKLYIFLSKFHLDDFYMRFFEGNREISNYIDKSEELLLEASQIFESLGDKTNQGYAFFNLANQLRTARKFRKAKKYLEKAAAIAREKNDIPLLESIKILEISIKCKNKDTPDYLNGEKRNFKAL